MIYASILCRAMVYPQSNDIWSLSHRVYVASPQSRIHIRPPKPTQLVQSLMTSHHHRQLPHELQQEYGDIVLVHRRCLADVKRLNHFAEELYLREVDIIAVRNITFSASRYQGAS